MKKFESVLVHGARLSLLNEEVGMGDDGPVCITYSKSLEQTLGHAMSGDARNTVFLVLAIGNGDIDAEGVAKHLAKIVGRHVIVVTDNHRRLQVIGQSFIPSKISDDHAEMVLEAIHFVKLLQEREKRRASQN